MSDDVTVKPYTGADDADAAGAGAGDGDAPETVPHDSEGKSSLRQELIAAAEAAKRGEDPEAAEVAEKAVPAAGEPAPEKPAENSIAALKKKMKDREKEHAVKLELERTRQSLQQQQQQAQKDAEETQRLKQELQQQLTTFKQNPLQFLETVGFDKDKLADHFVKAGTPEHALKLELDQTKGQVSELVQYLKQRDEQAQVQQQQQREQQLAQRREQANRDFLAKASVEVAPFLHQTAEVSGRGAEYIISEADKVADWYADQNGGKYPPWEDIIHYLEDRESEKWSKYGAKPRAQANGGQRKPQKTLSPGMSSERRAAPVPFAELSPEDRRRELVRVAEEAKRTG